MPQVFDENSQTWVDEADPSNADFTTSGVDLLDTLNEPDYRVGYTNPDPTAKQVGVDNATGNPIWQLVDAGGSIIQWAVDRFGNAIDFATVGTAKPDARLTYSNPDPTARKVGTDTATGNPIWQLTDAGGQVMQWMVDFAGNVLDLKPVGTPNVSKPVTTQPPANTSLLNTGNSATDLLNNILTGDNKDPSGAGLINIVNQTDNRPVTTTNLDNSNRSVVNTTTNISNSLNSPDLVSKVVTSIADLFKGGNPPLQSATSVSPSNDTIFGSRQTPQSRQAGMSLNTARMNPGSNIAPVATLKGSFGETVNNSLSSPLVIFGALASIVALFFIFRRGK
jgi:hypothetical protein